VNALTFLLGRPLGRLIDRDNPAEEDEDLQPYRLHLTCRRKSEQHIRALIVQHTTGQEMILRGIRATRADNGEGPDGGTSGGAGSEVRSSAHLLLDGDAASRLEQLVARLSLEPDIHAVHCHSAGDPDPALLSSDPAPASADD